MSSVAINFRSIGFNLTILNDYDETFINMQIWEEFLKDQMNKKPNMRWDVFVASIRHKLKAGYKTFLKDPSLRNDKNPEWKGFIDEAIRYFFFWAFIYDTPIYLVDLEAFDKVIQKGIYVNLTNSDRPNLIEGIPYVKYTKVGGR